MPRRVSPPPARRSPRDGLPRATNAPPPVSLSSPLSRIAVSSQAARARGSGAALRLVRPLQALVFVSVCPLQPFVTSLPPLCHSPRLPPASLAHHRQRGLVVPALLFVSCVRCRRWCSFRYASCNRLSRRSQPLDDTGRGLHAGCHGFRQGPPLQVRRQ